MPLEYTFMKSPWWKQTFSSPGLRLDPEPLLSKWSSLPSSKPRLYFRYFRPWVSAQFWPHSSLLMAPPEKILDPPLSAPLYEIARNSQASTVKADRPTEQHFNSLIATFGILISHKTFSLCETCFVSRSNRPYLVFISWVKLIYTVNWICGKTSSYINIDFYSAIGLRIDLTKLYDYKL